MIIAILGVGRFDVMNVSPHIVSYHNVLLYRFHRFGRTQETGRQSGGNFNISII